jgi:hypothetical protein
VSPRPNAVSCDTKVRTGGTEDRYLLGTGCYTVLSTSLRGTKFSTAVDREGRPRRRRPGHLTTLGRAAAVVEEADGATAERPRGGRVGRRVPRHGVVHEHVAAARRRAAGGGGSGRERGVFLC